MRHSIAALPLLAALLAAAPASSSLQPIRRDFGELNVPRLRAGTIRIPPGHARGRVRVIVTLALPPLAAARGRDLQAAGSLARLNARSAASRAYLARIDIAQRVAIARLRAAIPEARVTRRFRIVLDGLTVELPVRRLERLVALGWVARIYPSLQYQLRLNRSPSIIGTDVMRAATGADGAGVKIGVVDDGVDQTNPFFAPAGFSPPAEFPKGDLRFATAKVIVARSFPGPGSGAGGQLPVDRSASFHGTHVAGIAAGNAATSSPGGADHPPVTALSGVAPRAWIGNYRVFTVPTPIGHLANTPEIVAAFEAAVADGMDVINFSGGGPQIDPASDALNETVRNVAAAGVVPVISAGNDREDFGLGTVGAPSVAPEAISVAATSNLHVFAPALRITDADAPDFLRELPFVANERVIPADWPSVPHVLVDVGTVLGAGGTPVDRTLCGSSADPNDPRSNPLPPGSLSLPGGAIALVSRGICTFVSKAARAQAAGAIGMVVVDNREGEANPISVPTPIPAGMISNLDGARLRAFMATRGGTTQVLIGRTPLELVTGRGGIAASFSSAGPTAFGHLLKPDVAAPGASILSATLPEFAGGSPFAVFDGTSMAAPHVAGAAALLIQRHPSWTATQVKSALTSTAGSAWANTERTQEAPVLLEGGGLVNVPRADDPLIFTEPTSLSFGDLNVNRGAQTRELLLRVSDAGGGGGVWEVELAPQSASPGAVLTAAPVAVPPGGAGEVRVTAFAAADAQAGDDYGFIVLRRGDVTRRVPYLFLVTRPGLEAAQPSQLARVQSGTTVGSQSRASVYRFPAAPFGPPPDYTGPPMDEDGTERVYITRVDQRVVNIGVAVETSSQNALIHPFFLGSLDENDVQGYAGTPTNVNPLMFDFRVALGAAGVAFPPPKTYYVSVESGRELFTGRSRPGSYRLRSWVNDLEPPGLSLLTTTVAAGRPTIVVRATDHGAGVDPLSIVIQYGRAIVGAAAYDPDTGLAVIPLPVEAPALLQTTPATLMASDYQEAKNVNTEGAKIMPNTKFRSVSLRVVSGPVATWIRPAARACADRPREQLLVAASSIRRVREVRFLDGSRRIRTVRRGVDGLYATNWPTARLKRGTHRLVAVAVDAAGRTARATRTVHVCKRSAP